MTDNPLKAGGGLKEKSPTNPQACCDWANMRLHPKAVEENLQWVPTGDPKKPIELRKFV